MSSHFDPEELLECPFDKTHMIRAKRMQYHIQGCIKNFPNHNFEQCPFNARHWVQKHELRHHIATCDDKKTIELELDYLKNRSKKEGFFGGNVSVPTYDTQYAIDTSENWDDDASAPSFVLGQENKDHPKNASKVEHVFIHPAERPTQSTIPHTIHHSHSESEVRLPRHAPQTMLLQQQHQKEQMKSQGNTLGYTGYGQGVGTGEDQSVAILEKLGRGRGRRPAFMNNTNDSHVGNTALEQETKNNASRNIVGWQPLYVGTDQHKADSTCSDDSSSPNVPRKVVRQAGMVSQGRSVNAVTGFSPTGGRGSPVSQPKVWRGRGKPVQNTYQSSNASVSQMGRGIFDPTQKNIRPGNEMSRVYNDRLTGAQAFDSTGSNSPYSQSDTDLQESEQEKENLKQERKIRKKLKQIEALQMKQASGQQLTEEESDKILTKHNLIMQLEDLKLS